MTQEDLLAFYRSPGLFTDLDGYEGEVEGLPCDVAVIARTVQGLLIHEGLIGAYGASLPAERIAEKQLHSSVAMVARAMSLRQPGNRQPTRFRTTRHRRLSPLRNLVRSNHAPERRAGASALRIRQLFRAGQRSPDNLTGRPIL
jgi:hypothetical protein